MSLRVRPYTPPHTIWGIEVRSKDKETNMIGGDNQKAHPDYGFEYTCGSCGHVWRTCVSDPSCPICKQSLWVRHEIPQDEKPQKSGMKYDSGKLMYHLVPWWANWILARLLTYGAEKYAPDSWQHVPDAKNRYTSALIGHLEAWRGGVKNDTESGLPHLWHVFINVMFLIFLDDALPTHAERTISAHDDPASGL